MWVAPMNGKECRLIGGGGGMRRAFVRRRRRLNGGQLAHLAVMDVSCKGIRERVRQR
jgi:hypothetical protein